MDIFVQGSVQMTTLHFKMDQKYSARFPKTTTVLKMNVMELKEDGTMSNIVIPSQYANLNLAF